MRSVVKICTHAPLDSVPTLNYACVKDICTYMCERACCVYIRASVRLYVLFKKKLVTLRTQLVRVQSRGTPVRHNVGENVIRRAWHDQSVNFLLREKHILSRNIGAVAVRLKAQSRRQSKMVP